MKLAATRLTGAVLALFVLGTAQSQEARWQPFVSVAPVYEGKGDLDQGGDFSVWRAILRAGATGGIGGGHTAGVTLNYDYNDYSFSNPAAFGGVAPWNIVQRYGVAVPFSFALRDGWSVGFVPSVDWFRENGADTGDSLSWGAIVSATRRFADGNRLGLGVGIYDRIEETSAFPFLIVDWRLSDRWRLVNPLAAGPTGPAGLELDYRLDDNWELGIGAAWRRLRFRLSDSGPVPNGVGEERGLPVFVRATRHVGRQSTFHLFAGVVLAGELRVEDPAGNRLRSEDYDPKPLLGATFTARF
ncbi:MAG: hypothetical protein ACM36B_03230 [Bacteroidota bacterium]|jgi:hypothetical protein